MKIKREKDIERERYIEIERDEDKDSLTVIQARFPLFYSLVSSDTTE